MSIFFWKRKNKRLHSLNRKKISELDDYYKKNEELILRFH